MEKKYKISVEYNTDDLGDIQNLVADILRLTMVEDKKQREKFMGMKIEDVTEASEEELLEDLENL